MYLLLSTISYNYTTVLITIYIYIYIYIYISVVIFPVHRNYMAYQRQGKGGLGTYD